MELVPGLIGGLYVFDRAHSLLTEDAWKIAGPNIGKNGINLTISFLSMNRSSLSERLLRSIQAHLPQFAGEILIIDNGSTADELRRLKSICASLPFKVRIIEFEKNYGVAGGRNRTIPHVNTEWLMCLDNDIYFVSNPLEQFQRDLAMLGCHFMSLPLLDSDGETVFARGGHLYTSYENGELHIGAGSACSQILLSSNSAQPFLSTFLFGGACIFKKDTFLGMGGYDEAMFIGFEDIDFSIRLFQMGYKVGSTAYCALIHDHPKPVNESDRNYEQERFSRDVLKKSAQHLEAKHGFKIWSDAVDHWLRLRHQELGLEHAPFAALSDVDEAPQSNKPKIALVIDTDNWAFGNIARQLERYLSDSFDFLVIPMDIIDNIDRVFMLAADCDLVHFFWREHLNLIGTPYYRSYIESIGLSYENFYRTYIGSKIITTSVYDHLLLEAEELTERRHLFSGLLKGYTVGSQKLNTIYSSISNYPKPTSVVEDGVDLSLFKPINLNRFTAVTDRKLIVGWVGNSKWAAEIEDFKGVHSILKPAIERLQQEGFGVEALFADRQEQFIPHEQMPAYYSKIDVLVCSSKVEGTPNPVLEAMACGVPIISTDVGIVPQVFGNLQRTFILRERSIEALYDALSKLIADSSILSRLSVENLDRIKSWDWEIQAKKFGEFFKKSLGI